MTTAVFPCLRRRVAEAQLSSTSRRLPSLRNARRFTEGVWCSRFRGVKSTLFLALHGRRCQLKVRIAPYKNCSTERSEENQDGIPIWQENNGHRHGYRPGIFHSLWTKRNSQALSASSSCSERCRQIAGSGSLEWRYANFRSTP